MKKLTLILSLSFVFFSFLCAQDNPVLNNNGLTYDSVMSVLNQKDIPFNTKYKMVRQDIITLDPLDKTTEIFIKTLSLAKKEKADPEIFVLYNLIAHNYYIIRNTDVMKLYLDSASLYINKTEDPNSLGIHHYLLGSYFQIMDDGAKSRENNFKAIEYLEKVGGRENLIISIYYNMCIEYSKIDDVQSFKSIIDKMKAINKKNSSFQTDLMIYQITAGYFNSVLKQTKDNAYRDSIKYYNKKGIDLYESLNEVEQSIAKSHIIFDYYNFVDIDLKTDQPNIGLIDKYMIKLEELIEPTDTSRLIWYHCTNGLLLTNNKQYQKAEKELLKALNYQEHHTLGKVISEYMYIYERLASLYQLTGRYEEAVKYRILKEENAKEVFEEKRYETVKELDTKYETAQKDLKISQLNEEKQKARFLMILIIAVAVFSLTLLLIALLYSRLKRLKKEKEANMLSNRIKEKEAEYQLAINKMELDSMQSYLNGLETERERLAKELHDNVANELICINFQLQKDQIPEKILGQLEDLHTEIRSISHELMPPKFKYANLPEIIYDYIYKLNIRNDVQIEVDLENEYLLTDLSDKMALEIYRIIQEAVGNIVKHAQATTGKITLKYTDDILHLIIEDNGRGYNPELKHNGIGLRIIRDRIKSLNGNIDIDTADGMGCRIDITLPTLQSDDNK